MSVGEPLPARLRDARDVASALASAGETWSEAAVAGAISVDGGFCLVVRTEPEGIAGALIGRVVADEAEVLQLVVAGTHRRRGIGSALVRAALESAGARGARRVFLEVRQGNAPARALYERGGFRPVGRRVHYYPGGEDALVLAIDLA